MSAPLCTVCLDTGSKSQQVEGMLDCTACSAADERVMVNNLIRKKFGFCEFATQRAAWAAYLFAQRKYAPVVPVAAQPVVPEVPPSVLARTEEIRKLMGNHTSISRSTLLSYIEFLLAHIAFTNAPQPAASVTDVAKDAERLDFILKEGAFIVWSMRDGTIRQCQLMNQDEDEDFHYISGDDRYFNTEREAIDAAIAAQQGEKT